MEQYKKDIISQNKEFQDIIYPLITNDTVQQMKNFKQHYETTCFEHAIQQHTTVIVFVKS
ncbi:MAG: hypothetical protein ACLTXR_02255 [Clostridia bacterium]